ncbi:hypothetical protein AEAC466_14095 [Asticcacaulis sp. AC466]|uniref:DUF805 domain-containing protein n=1 Tax=Asticcacaulis sp. AC466 TaxID=1282362 RepID=UPI0003C3D405|nr:DUF805 domain-containing protein [Asticcacaulis sp. AC466]ESQ83376.1 hypothetical protein AEAC466_14095 [Asticcacaulis sp. AC466]
MPLFLQPFVKYADFNGRARRAEYWQWCAFQSFAGVIFEVLRVSDGNKFIALFQGLFSLAILIPSIAVAVRRFHDTDRTGWWFLFAPVVGTVALVIYLPVGGATLIANLQQMRGMGPQPTGSQAALLLHALSPVFVIMFIWMAAATVTFVFHLLPGTQGSNRFGPDPKGDGSDISRIFEGPAHERAARESHDDANVPHTPVFDFSPAGKTQMRTVAPVMESPAYPTRPMAPSSTAARPTFGKRR